MTLSEQAAQAAKQWRNAVKRGDIDVASAFHASGVGYPYMTAAEYSAAKSTFERECK